MGAQAFEGAFNTLCGDILGEGVHRKVFTCKIDASLVVKVETDEDRRSFANAYEWRNWIDNEFCLSVSRWLAPTVSISPCGLVLLQKRVIPLRATELPVKLPRFLTDLKPCNFGLYEGRVVACDYTSLIVNARTEMRGVNWHDDE